MRVYWGLIVILIGVWLFGENFSWWNHFNLNYIWHFWPLLLILFGIALIVRSLRFGWIIVLLSFVAAVGFIVVFMTNEKLVNKITSNGSITNLSNFSEDLNGGVTRGEVSIQSAASSINLGSSNDKFIEGSLDSIFFEPVLNVNTDGSLIVGKLTMENNTQWNNLNSSRNNLVVNLTNRIPLDVSIDSGASDLNLDFSKITLSGLKINASASSVKLIVGENILDNSNVSISSGASSLELTIPESIGVRAEVKSGLSSRDFQDFKSLGGGSYESNNYSSATKKITLNIDAGVSSIKITRQ